MMRLLVYIVAVFLWTAAPALAGGKGSGDAMDRILKMEKGSPAFQKRIKNFERESGAQQAVKEYERTKSGYQKTLHELEKIQKTDQALMEKLKEAFAKWSADSSSKTAWKNLGALEKKVLEGRDRQSRLLMEADQLRKETLQNFFAALQTKKNAYALEHKHQLTELARREGRDVPIPKPQH